MGSPPDVWARQVEHDPRTTRRRDTNAQCKEDFVDPIKVGVITDQTGPLSVIGLANANVARMVVGDINAKGGLLGRDLELHLEDSETSDDVAAAKAAILIERDVDVILGGI